MKVSVVIPAFNEERFIGSCIQHLRNQSVLPVEILVIDNNSTDRTAAIAQTMGVQVLFERAQGITPARDTGFNAARGDIIARCDADTRVFSNWIAQLKKAFEDPTVVGVTGTNEFYDAPAKYKALYERVFTATYFQGNRYLLGHEAFYGSNMALRKTAWDGVKSFLCDDDKMVHEDIDLAVHLAQYGRIVYDPALMVGSSCRALSVRPSVMAERLAKWPRSKLVHTRLKPLVRAGKYHSSTAQNTTK